MGSGPETWCRKDLVSSKDNRSHPSLPFVVQCLREELLSRGPRGRMSAHTNPLLVRGPASPSLTPVLVTQV